MSAPELRATVSLAGVFALRMLGLFMIMPVFSIYARTIPGGDDVLLTICDEPAELRELIDIHGGSG